MQIVLTNGTILSPILITGSSVYLQNANRDALTFIFGDMSMDELDNLFTETNCESIKIIGDADEEGSVSEDIYTGYVIRVNLTKKKEITQQATSDTAEVSESRVQVTMAQRTYAETQVALLQKEMTNTQLALIELYEGGLE